MSTAEHTKLDASLLRPASGRRRKRFLAISVAALAVLAVSMGVSFLGTTGATTISASASGSNEYIFPVGASKIEGTVPSAVEKLKYESSSTASTLPSLGKPTAETAGEVEKSGDLALVDASSGTLGNATELIVNVYVTNLAKLSLDYSSFALPVTVYEAECTSESKCTNASWTKELTKLSLLNTEGMFSFRVKGKSNLYLDIAMNNGGSYYFSENAGGELGPAFYFTAQPV